MSKTLKAGILLMILAIPAFIIFFLQGFGDNQFTIPVYYENGVDTAFVDCNWKTPHLVEESADLSLKGNYTVIGFRMDQYAHDPDLSWRILTDFDRFDNIQSMVFLSGDSAEQSHSRTSWNQLTQKEVKFISQDSIQEVLSCEFIVDLSKTEELPMILVDPNRRIRGYYYASDEDEFDRLIHELNILFGQENE